MRKHTVLGHTTGISSILKTIVNGEFNLRVFKALNSKVRVISKDFMKRNRTLLVDVQCVRPIIQNNLLSIFLRVPSSNVVLYANINTMYHFINSF